MADFQRVPLTYSSRAAFEAATTGAGVPIMAHITGESSPCYGLKIAGVYRYHADQSAALAALQNDVTDLQNANSDIHEQLWNLGGLLNASAGVIPKGALIAPFGHTFNYVQNSNGKFNPLVAAEASYDLGTGSSVGRMFIGGKALASMPYGGYYFRIRSGDETYISVYASYEDADNTDNELANASVGTWSTPGLFIFESTSPSGETWGWMHETLGIPSGLVNQIFQVGPTRRDFGVSKAEMNSDTRYVLEFSVKGDWNTDAPEMQFHVALGEYNLLPNLGQFTLQIPSEFSGTLRGKVTIDCFGLAPSGNSQFRTKMELYGDSSFGYSEPSAMFFEHSPADEAEMYAYYMPDVNYFDISVVMDDTSSAVSTFQLLDSRMTRHPSPVSVWDGSHS